MLRTLSQGDQQGLLCSGHPENWESPIKECKRESSNIEQSTLLLYQHAKWHTYKHTRARVHTHANANTTNNTNTRTNKYKLRGNIHDEYSASPCQCSCRKCACAHPSFNARAHFYLYDYPPAVNQPTKLVPALLVLIVNNLWSLDHSNGTHTFSTILSFCLDTYCVSVPFILLK